MRIENIHILLEQIRELPPFIVSLSIVFLSTVSAKILNLVFKLIFDLGIRRTATKLDDRLFDHFKAGVFWSVVLSGLYLSLRPFPEITFKEVIFRRILFSGGTVVWSIVALRTITSVTEFFKKKYTEGGRQEKTGLLTFIDGLTKVGLVIFFVLALMGIWRVSVTPVLASAGVAGVAVAFAAKDTISNLFGGFSIFFDKPYKVGDYLIIEGKYRGEVVEIGARSTKIKTRDDILLTVPNSVMVTQLVINETGRDGRLRIRIPIGVAYGTDLDRAEMILTEILKSHGEILDLPAPMVRYRRFGESAVELEALAVLRDPAKRGLVVHQLIKNIHRRFEDEGVEMPPPQREVHLAWEGKDLDNPREEIGYG